MSSEARRTDNPEVLRQRIAQLERENEDLLHARRLHEVVLESIVDYAIFTLDSNLRVTSWNPGCERLLGWTPMEIVGREGDILFVPEDRARGAVDNEARIAAAEGRAVNERWHLRKDGTRFWGSGLMMPLAMPEGDPHRAGFVKVMRDHTERQRALQRQQLLLAELTHRVKNTLAIVQSLADQTLRSTPDPAAFGAAYRARLAALARAHDVLTREVWERASITGVAEAALGAWMSEGRITANGPQVWLAPAQALTLSLALHELATNAVKYGALSVPDGNIDLAWRVDEMVELQWIETGGPAVTPPTRAGFGSRILTRALAQDLKGEVDLVYDPAGLHFTLRFTPPDLDSFSRLDDLLTR
jgi:PAS domain S-box-containing protein